MTCHAHSNEHNMFRYIIGIPVNCPHLQRYFNEDSLPSSSSKSPFSPVDFKSNPEISCLNRQDEPLDRKFSALYDGISCQFVGVEQFSQSKKL